MSRWAGPASAAVAGPTPATPAGGTSAPRAGPRPALPRAGGQRPRPQAQDRRYRDGDGRRPERGQATRPGDYDYPQRRPGRYDSGPLEQPADARRPVTASTRRPGSGRDHGGRRAGNGHGRPESATALYDTGPARHPAADDFPSEPLRAADFPSGEFPSRPQPADFPSGEFPSASRSAADAPTARYRTAGPHTDEFASGPLPEADFASSEFPAADFPSEEMPAARTRARRRRRPTPAGTAPTHAAGRARGRTPRRGARASATTMTGPAWSGTSSPTSSTGRSCRLTSHWPPPPAAHGRPASPGLRPVSRQAGSVQERARQARGRAAPQAGAPPAQPAAPHARSRDLADRKPAEPPARGGGGTAKRRPGARTRHRGASRSGRRYPGAKWNGKRYPARGGPARGGNRAASGPPPAAAAGHGRAQERHTGPPPAGRHPHASGGSAQSRDADQPGQRAGRGARR